MLQLSALPMEEMKTAQIKLTLFLSLQETNTNFAIFVKECVHSNVFLKLFVADKKTIVGKWSDKSDRQ